MLMPIHRDYDAKIMLVHDLFVGLSHQIRKKVSKGVDVQNAETKILIKR